MVHSSKECHDMIKTICERAADKLTKWESDFIDNIYDHTSFTPKQAEIIDRIHTEKVTDAWGT